MRSIDGIITTAYCHGYMGTVARTARLLETHPEQVGAWKAGKKRPSRYSALRMCRLLMWGAATWPDEAGVHWKEMRVESIPDPFALSPHTRFGFGGPRDSGALIRDAMKRLGIDRRGHLGRLLGVPQTLEYRYVMTWANGVKRTGPRYLLRLLALLMWDWRGYPVSDMWSVDWAHRTIEWSWDGNSLAPKPLAGSPFEWMELIRSPGRPPTRRLAVQPIPIYMVAANA